MLSMEEKLLTEMVSPFVPLNGYVDLEYLYMTNFQPGYLFHLNLKVEVEVHAS